MSTRRGEIHYAREVERIIERRKAWRSFKNGALWAAGSVLLAALVLAALGA